MTQQPNDLQLDLGVELAVPASILIVDGTRNPEVAVVIEANQTGGTPAR
jgi:hypothetical protein